MKKNNQERMEAKTFDCALLLERYRSVEDVLFDAIGIFTDDYPKILEEIRRAIEEKDSVLLSSTAHSLKGVMRSLCANSCELAAQLENLGEDLRFAEASEVAQSLDRELQMLAEELNMLKL